MSVRVVFQFLLRLNFCFLALGIFLSSDLLSSEAFAQKIDLKGRVLVGSYGIAGVTVSAGYAGSGESDKNGYFRIVGLEQAKEYTLVSGKRGYSFSRQTVVAKLPGAHNIRISGKCGSGYVVIDRECWPSDPKRRDRDEDGLTDYEEEQHGTSPTNRDTDNDAVDDGQEVTDGSNPADKGSVLSVLGTTVCSDWNGFLGGMYNIQEHVSNSRGQLYVYATLYNSEGAAQAANLFEVPRGAQYDLLVHGMNGRVLNQVGRVCSRHEGNPGDLDGRMLYYRLPSGVSAAANKFEFAFAMPFSNGIRGIQNVSFNTYQPSLNPADAHNFVANWIQLTNMSAKHGGGVLTFYEMNGAVLGKQVVSLPGNARRDYSGHQFGASKVGSISWQPDRNDIAYQLRNLRYFYNNPGHSEAFTTAFQLEGAAGSGELLSVPLDTRAGTAVIEVLNTTAKSVYAQVNIYTSMGALVRTIDIGLAPFASHHLIADPILFKSLGMATIKGSAKESIVATAMQYGRNVWNGLEYMYGVPAVQALGTELGSSYNTYLDQQCRLILVNHTNSIQTFNASMVRSDGRRVSGPGSGDKVPADIIQLRRDVVIAPHGAKDFNLCANDEKNKYGVVKVQARKPNTISGVVVRVGANNQYRFPTPLRQ